MNYLTIQHKRREWQLALHDSHVLCKIIISSSNHLLDKVVIDAAIIKSNGGQISLNVPI
jgi:hypothetical protein